MVILRFNPATSTIRLFHDIPFMTNIRILLNLHLEMAHGKRVKSISFYLL
uniref:Uncharacterized protein n=1 Tax=Klebsiella pneumoniae TaxID=573 RepID=A0A8B0SRX2_KLEPN|nr:hypothetical protein [Klebsiella pneumoniae]